MTETQERFLRSVLTLVPLESVVELHLFAPIRRGTLETGVAVIATTLPAPALAVVEESADAYTESADVLTESADEAAPVVLDDRAEEQSDTAPASAPRLRIMTASYRHTIKGVERGKWTFDVQVEADAPYEAVELVLRGVRHRSSEPADPERVHPDALAALDAPSRVAPAA